MTPVGYEMTTINGHVRGRVALGILDFGVSLTVFVNRSKAVCVRILCTRS